MGLARGIGGSRAWLAVGVTAGAFQVVRRALKREPEIVYREELHPGQSLVIQHLPRAD
ncbi:MAG: hypothetical protein M3203_06380 [Actinomycetota bacterium]|nr:hypothetical protein [Actinomycetota bacterium]